VTRRVHVTLHLQPLQKPLITVSNRVCKRVLLQTVVVVKTVVVAALVQSVQEAVALDAYEQLLAHT
jgi:hypothetical protein